ncbi:MAG: dynamin family protein [Sulfobacillus sp.]
MNKDSRFAAFNALTSYLWSSDNRASLLTGTNRDILRIGALLNQVRLSQSVPKMVVVGGQSSGKSSLLNAVTGLEILPTGSNMVTRTPICLDLVPGSPARADFAPFPGMAAKSLELSFPTLTALQKKALSQEILARTEALAGTGMGISAEPVFLRVQAPEIPELSLIDLPGLTMVACTDRGQPPDIKNRIRAVISKYIEQPDTIVLAVMPARSDLEADATLDLIKEHDAPARTPGQAVSQRTLGVLTKVDLMPDASGLSPYLEPGCRSVSKDLHLGYGYHAVVNTEGERQFFEGHKELPNERVGTPALCAFLGKVLLQKLQESMPKILEAVAQRLCEVQKELSVVGESPIKDQKGWLAQLQVEFSRNFSEVLNGRGQTIGTGFRLRETFRDFRRAVSLLDTCAAIPDARLDFHLKNNEGNHLPSAVSSVEILENCVAEAGFHGFSGACLTTVQKVVEVLKDLGRELLRPQERFKGLHSAVEQFLEELIHRQAKCAGKAIAEFLRMQESYVWTDDPTFLDLLNKPCGTPAAFRKLLRAYFQTTALILQDQIPKMVMEYLVRRTELGVKTELPEKLSGLPLDKLLQEDQEVVSRREALLREKAILEEIQMRAR